MAALHVAIEVGWNYESSQIDPPTLSKIYNLMMYILRVIPCK